MNALIAITNELINGSEIQTVNARDLHTFLESKQQFADWIKNRIDQYGFIDGQDFTIHKVMNGRFAQSDYHLSLDMGKELAMVERNAKGKIARQYFIECEKRLKSVPAIPKTYAAALRAAADLHEQIEQQQAELAAAAPKVEFVDRYVESSTGAKGFRQVCKLLGAKEPEFREFLVARKIMYFLNGEWTAYAYHLDAGRFEVKTGTAPASEHAYNATRFTAKGIAWISALWSQRNDRGEAA